MKHMKKKSHGIYYIVFLFLLLLLLQIVLYGNYFDRMKNSIDMLNDASIIRGGIQRYAKLEIGDATIAASMLKDVINDKFSHLLGGPDHGLNGAVPVNEIKRLYTKWNELNSLIKSYHADQSRGNMLAVVNKSEECWDIANVAVLRQQYVLDRAADYYLYFTFALGANLFAIALVLILYKKFVLNNLTNSAINDSLTEVFNKGYFDEYLEYEIARAVRNKVDFSLIMLDIDHFKRINDTFGHQRGDYALKSLAGVVQRCKRNSDVLSRVGGEEFIVLLPDTDLLDAIQLAERIRRSVEEFPFEEIGKMTVSLGVTEFQEADNKESILKRVDSALYKAKGNGRNRIAVIRGDEDHEQENFSHRA